jgi:serine/threonine-protein kinase RsbW
MQEEPDTPGGGADAAPETLVLEMPSDIDLVEGAVADLVEHCRDHIAPASRLLLNFRVGVTEALANAILYANNCDPEKRVLVSVSVSRSAVVVEVSGEGRGFDPDAVPDPTLPENLHRTGGRGVFLIRKLMDEVEYFEQGNSVRLVLYRRSTSRRAAGS